MTLDYGPTRLQPVLRSLSERVPPTRTERRSRMITFLTTLSEEELLTYEVSDEALENAGANETATNYTLAACPGLSVCQVCRVSKKDRRKAVFLFLANVRFWG